MDSLIPTEIIIVGLVAILICLAVIAWVMVKAREVNLTRPTDEKPAWMRYTPPAETLAATKADKEGVQVFNYDKGENVASPFAEQIEDIWRAKLAENPALKDYQVDLGTAPDGGLEITVNGEKYRSVDALPDARLKELFLEAVAKWKGS
jgi:hypothetical protein